MREIIFVIFFAALLPVCFRFPHIGLLIWGWIAVMAPHRSVYGFGADLPYNMVVAAFTIGGLFFCRETIPWPRNGFGWLLVIFTIWATITTFTAFNVDYSYIYWDRTMKDFLYVFLLMAVMRNRIRIHALIWIIAISLGYYGIKDGLFLIATAGHYIISGPPDTAIADNNTLALATIMAIPLMNYLRLHSRDARVRLALVVTMALSTLAVIGSYSRGGFLSLMLVLGLIGLRSRHKWIPVSIAVVVIAVAAIAMPDSYVERLHSIENAGVDESFVGRTRSWWLALTIAQEQLTGAGFYGPQHPDVYARYLPGYPPLAAHSIYFQVLGEHGFPGLALFLLCCLTGWRYASLIQRRTADREEWAWASDFAAMSKISFLGYFVGGAGLSLAYFNVTWMLWAVMAALYEMTRELPPASLPYGAVHGRHVAMGHESAPSSTVL